MDRRGAVGFIEAEGLPAAIAAADAAVKSANVSLVGRENSRGGGFITIKISGDVGAVKAALEAARTVSDKVHGTHSVLAIPRPAEGIGDALVWNENTMGADRPDTQPSEAEPAPSAVPVTAAPAAVETEGPDTSPVESHDPEASSQAETVTEAGEAGSEGPAEGVAEDVSDGASPVGPEPEGGASEPPLKETPQPDATVRPRRRGRPRKK